ncbi:hypothetical protein EIP86_006043, partial [Pleurotus ostreatoroseus]
EESDSDYSSSDEEYDDIQPAYNVGRPTKRITEARKDKNDGILGDAKKEIARKRAKARNEEEEASKPRTRSSPKNAPYKPKRQVEVSIPVQTPIDVFRTPIIPTGDNDVIMEDPALKPVRKNNGPRKENAKTDKESKEGQITEKRIPRKSEIQANVDPLGVLSKVLQTPVTLQVGEVFGISKEMTHHLQDAIRPKRPEQPAVAHVERKYASDDDMVAASFFTQSRGTLIRLKMECDGIPITAIVDTGSQLNIAHKKTWKQILSRPMDLSKSVTMNDANGGEGVLQGFVPNVPLTCGNVLTHANIFIGDKAPFDLLLGRPWQRGNFVSIDERIDGTYLLFKDQNLRVRYEILVTPDPTLANREAEIIEYLSKTHLNQSNQSFYSELAGTPKGNYLEGEYDSEDSYGSPPELSSDSDSEDAFDIFSSEINDRSGNNSSEMSELSDNEIPDHLLQGYGYRDI